MKKKILLIPLALLLVISLVATGCPAPAPPPAPPPPPPAPAPAPPPPKPVILETIHLRFTTFLPPVGYWADDLWKPFFAELEKRSDGRITSTLFFANAIAPTLEHYDAVVKGMADIGYTALSWTPGRFPLSDMLGIPTGPKDLHDRPVATDIAMALYEKMLYREFPDAKPLYIGPCKPPHAIMFTEPASSLEDIKGRKVRSAGGLMTPALEALGLVPMFMPLGDVYVALQTGVLDGMLTCPELVLDFKVPEVAKYAYLVPSVGCITDSLFMNLDTWERTPDDLKPIIEELGRNPFAWSGIFTEKWYWAKIDELKAAGVTVVEATPAEMASLEPGYKAFIAKWAEDLEAKGHPAKEFLRLFKAELDKRGLPFAAYPY